MKELEVKILNIDLLEMEKKLKKLDAKLIDKEFQINTLIDLKEKCIENKLDSYLRIRETRSMIDDSIKITLTMKENIDREKIRENLETNIDISDRDAMIYLLEKLGYKVREVGRKERISYLLKGVRFDLDTWDKATYPDPYMEIELNDENELEQIVKLLNINERDVSTKSILELRRDKDLI